MLLLGTVNTASQTVETDGSVNLGSTYRKYCKTCGSVGTFTNSGTAVSLNQSGIYHITATFVGAGTEAGTITLTMALNGTALPRAVASETITTAETELRTLVIDDYVLVDNTCVLGRAATTPAVISFINSGIGTTFTLVKMNIEKVL